jgi:hypothetical protein
LEPRTLSERSFVHTSFSNAVQKEYIPTVEFDVDIHQMLQCGIIWFMIGNVVDIKITADTLEDQDEELKTKLQDYVHSKYMVVIQSKTATPLFVCRKAHIGKTRR